MTDPIVAQLVEETRLTLEEMAAGCRAEIDWVVARVHDVLARELPGADPAHWRFSGTDLLRLRRIRALERDFDAVPELAALVADLLEELERLRARLRRAGLSVD
ncbi:MAG: MerR family transcriptional regulator [Pseudomonadales bacterium]|nr:MerR family transcriptional regulator [Pseudomonadales bacterium]